jgi:hypothetical protein
MTRVIKNPYPDRTLSINVFQLVKHFSVETKLSEIRLALIIPIISLVFDNEFVVSNGDFLRDNLLDQSLVDELPISVQGARSLSFEDTRRTAIEVAKLALRYLYNDPANAFSSNIFNVQDIIQPNNPNFRDANDPKNSFDARINFGQSTGDITGFFDNSALAEAIQHNLGIPFTVLNLFFKVYEEKINTGTLDESAIEIAEALSSYLKGWEGDSSQTDDIRNVLDQFQYTEVFRRLTGFLAIVSGMLDPLVKPAEDEEKAIFALDRLKRHLECHKNYYIQKFLAYVARQTDNQDIVDFVNRVFARAITDPNLLDQVNHAFDVERSFVDRQQIMVPSFVSISPDAFQEMFPDAGPINPTVIEVDVPSDGIHLETAEGACILANVPPQTAKSLEFTIHDASLKIDDP